MNKKNITKSTFKDALNFFKKGNILLLAIAFLAGAVFNAVVASLANDIIMSAIAELIGGKSLNEWKVGGMLVGKFLGTVINFVIVTALLFILLFTYFLIRNIRIAKKEKNAPAPVVEPAKPTVEELMLEQLQSINEKLQK
ncbi:large-conductance mechanosensitive channel [Mycoplasmopsis canis UFG4]|uniref:Large-conductance mechanosensitive channel n=2 Tax=Mycoplasmopsis canis TaxID=29555 RepID=I1A4M8_9BACT|nr:MscL family protein [Mycoplasmopsis canis]AKF41353.1 mechanosensitive ion channel protein MscL [Mycoplasmopsis canis]AMD81472.1 mechanosensitive ion channel protein MscL [Mycoplasmopsis canis PG 14]EIE39358.1 large-conductance mechanosensitive channel [Mycoplasmopsis canis UF33]EIE39509.1 large-conductance mechanosensitive channel [Mycoplasmopsis canis PG 14]EIE39663.1 large-conductance mechanosensitive channel [Mycoplasmopsis canis UF31]